jgi:predicted metal-dependent hydrolase
MPEIDYTLVRSRRRTISIVVTQEAAVVVRAPLRAPKRVIDYFVVSKHGWILAKQAIALRRAEACKPVEFASGEEFPFLGGLLMLAVSDQARRPECVGNTLVIPKSRIEEAGDLLAKWYAGQAKRIISERVSHYSALTGIMPLSVSVTSARRRWGSCNAQGRLNFAWRLVMAPVDEIDYVVVHELAHIEHHDHSRAFWARVGEIMPDYKAKRQWLKENNGLLNLF